MRRMGSLVLGVLSSGLAASAVMAADLPMVTKAPPVSPIYDWSGFYIGGEAGGDLLHSRVTIVDGNANFPSGTVLNAANGGGFVGGGYAGYNYQIQRQVVGIDGDYSWTNVSGPTATVGPTGFTTSSTIKADWSASVTGRVGFAFDNLLIYGKAGWAWAGLSANGVTTNPAGVPTTLTSDNGTRDGVTAGFGLDWGFARNWSARFEYDYIAFNTANYLNTNIAVPSGATTFPARSADSQMHLFKVGVAYRFSPAGF